MLHWFARRMKEMHEKDENGEKGFTLIELLVVVIIIGVLAAIAIPTFLAQRERSLVSECESDTRNAGGAANGYAANQPDGTYAGATMVNLAADFGFRQSPNTTTAITGTPGATIVFTSTCGDNAGSTSVFDSDVGTVVTT